MKSLEKRFYPREELAEIAGLDARGHNFSTQMKHTLTLWGYEYEFKPRKGFLITKVPETAEERLIEILRRDIHIDTQINPLHFACFLSAFIFVEKFFSMPWEEREEIIWKFFGISITDRTMMNWRNKLIERGYLIKSRSGRNLWHTVAQGGKKVRENVDPESPEYKTYSELRSGILKSYDALGVPVRQVWGEMVKQLYGQHGVYYYCDALYFNVLKRDEWEGIRELALEIVMKTG